MSDNAVHEICVTVVLLAVFFGGLVFFTVAMMKNFAQMELPKEKPETKPKPKTSLSGLSKIGQIKPEVLRPGKERNGQG